MRSSRTRAASGIVLAALGAWTPWAPLQAQEVRKLVEACGGQSTTLRSLCAEAVLAAQAAQSGLGLGTSLGSEVTGAASTLGWRLKGSPRISLSVRGSLVRSHLPDLRTGSTESRRGHAYTLVSGQAVGSVGVFDGFSPAPTVGGVLALDLTASAHLVSAPAARGFQEGIVGWGAGARLGLLRESFTLPGISLSGFYRGLGSNGVGGMDEGDPAGVRFDLAVSSVRGVVGKDLWGVGLSGGVGWDRYQGETHVRVMDVAGASEATGDLSSDRFLYFVAGTLTYLVLQTSVELGWAEGFDLGVPPGTTVEFDPSSRSYFGSLAFRLTF